MKQLIIHSVEHKQPLTRLSIAS